MSVVLDKARRTRNLVRILRECFSAAGMGLPQLQLLRWYASNRLFPEFSDQVHLDATMKWLCLAQDVMGSGGVSAGYYLRKGGWDIEYPETTGYIIATYLSYAKMTGDKSPVERSVRAGDWEIRVQAPNGGVFSDMQNLNTRVFNTGQVILGWCALYEKTGEQKYLDAAVRAGKYLVRIQEYDGSWQRDTYCGARTYHARTDWGLLRLFLLSGEKQFADVAVRNFRWVLSQQKKSGWFDNCGLRDALPITHVIGYTLRGLLECHALHIPDVRGLEILPKIVKAADALCEAMSLSPVRGIAGMVPASFDHRWESTDKYSCLTGNAQLACFLYRLTQITKNPLYAKSGDIILHATKRTQLIAPDVKGITGAIAGSFPFYQGYVPYGYPNWAAKFFADAIMMKTNYQNNLEVPA